MSDIGQVGHLGELVSGCSIVVVTGTGGVGKTTISAALAIAAASQVEGDTLVLTIDPARRLATALGMEIEGNEAHEIPMPIEGPGRLFAAMLDPGPAWDDLVTESAPDAATVDAILANPVYRRIADTFVHGNEYAALSWLNDAIESEAYRLIIVDTPPSQSSIGLFDAPAQVESFFTSNLLGWLTKGDAGSFLGGAAAKSFGQLADRLLGAQFFGAVVEFFSLMQSVVPGMIEQTARVADELASDDTRFVAVASPSRASIEGVDALAADLAERDLVLDALVVNGVEPDVFVSEKMLDVARQVVALDPARFSQRMTNALQPGADYVVERSGVAVEQRRRIATVDASIPAVMVPRMVHSPNTVESLTALGAQLWAADPNAS